MKTIKHNGKTMHIGASEERAMRIVAHSGVDYASGSDRWYGYGMEPDNSIAKLQAAGMFLSRISE